MPPILATASRLMCAEAQTLKHGAFLLERIIVAFATTKSVAEVVVVLVACGCRLRVDAFAVRLWVYTQAAWACARKSGGTAIAGKVTLGEDFDKCMLAVALYGACITDSSGIVRSLGVRWWGVTGKAGEDSLTQ